MNGVYVLIELFKGLLNGLNSTQEYSGVVGNCGETHYIILITEPRSYSALDKPAEKCQ